MNDERADRTRATTRRDVAKLAVGAAAGLGLAAPAALVHGQTGATPAASPAAPPPSSAAQNLTIHVGDIDIAYRVLGQGEPIVLIMGTYATMDLWDPTLLDELAARHLLVLFDNRGMGGTSGTGPYPFEQLGDDTAGLIQALGLGPTNIFGWSMGGNIALDLSVRHPDVVRKSIPYAANPGGPQAAAPSPAVIAALADQSGTLEERGRRLLEILFPVDWLRQNQAYVARVFLRPMEPTSPAGAGLQVRALSQWAGVSEQLAKITAPTMIVQGMDDVIAPPQNAQLIADSIPGSWLIRLAGTGHGAMFQEPKRVAALVEAFLGA
jgi:pimeloyl-ACP methyl ester carboxylesterase